ncbi:MAG: hypothetical protein WC391_03150 [Methanoregula sp.]|jgi:hypothetical protein
MLYETRFLLALVTTWAIEIPVLVGLIRFLFHHKKLPLIQILFSGILCTALTLPYLWFVLPPFVDGSYYPFTGEVLVVIVEAVILKRLLGLEWKQAGTCSLVMNAVSFGVGLFIL